MDTGIALLIPVIGNQDDPIMDIKGAFYNKNGDRMGVFFWKIDEFLF
jgi:hypothetical protein